MPHKRIILFLALSVIFAVVHYLAVRLSLYWYLWWFDILMHFWGGALVALGMHALSTFSFVTYKPTLKLLIILLIIVTSTWEVFERSVGLFDQTTYIFDTVKDIAMGFIGGLLTHYSIRAYTLK